MKDFKPIDDTAESVEKRMTFIQEFLQKKYGFGILFFVLVLVSIYAAVESYSQGKKDGFSNSNYQIQSLTSANKNYESENIKLKNSVTNFEKLYADCINKNNNIDLEAEVKKQLEKSKRLESILERKISTTERQTQDLNSIIPKIK